MYNVNGELPSCDITYSGRVPSREGDIHNFALSFLLNGLSKSTKNFTDGFLKLLYTQCTQSTLLFGETSPLSTMFGRIYGGMEYTISRPTCCYSVL